MSKIGKNIIRPIFNPKIIGITLYIKLFLENLLFGALRIRSLKDDPSKCVVCGKPLKEKRFEICIQIPKFDYDCEHDRFYCLDHAIEFLLNYKKRTRGSK